MNPSISRRDFVKNVAIGAGLIAFAQEADADEKPIQGLDDTVSNTSTDIAWKPVSDRRIRVGIVGYGVCQFGAAFSFQDHPNVEVVAVSDLIPERCAGLAKACRCEKTYPSLEELVKDERIEAVFVATDAPSHARHCTEVLRHGKHVACAVPAAFGSVEEAAALYDAVKASGLIYMMFETTTYQNDCYAMRQAYEAGALGKLIYTEGEYFHHAATPIDSFKGWRVGLPPQWYPTHSNAYHTSVSGGRFTEVSCMGIPSIVSHLQPANNPYRNAFGTEIALFRTSEGGTARMGVSWDSPGREGVLGRVRGQKGAMEDQHYQGAADISTVILAKPPLPPHVVPGGHWGSHGYLCDEFVSCVLHERRPSVDIATALNLTVAGIVAHESALKDGELMKIPQFEPLQKAAKTT